MKSATILARKIEEDRRYQLASVVFIIVLGAALRFYKLGFWSIWIDEIFTINRAQVNVNMTSLLAAWWHPSISLILTDWIVDTLGFSIRNARLAAALIGIASLPILFIYVKRWFGVLVALITVFLLTISPWHIEWSQNARYYTSQLLFYFLVAYYFFLALEKDRPKWFLVAGLFWALAIGERFTAIFFLPSAIIYVLVLVIFPFEKPPGFNKKNLLILGLPLVGFLLFEIMRYLISGTSYLLSASELTYSQPIDDPIRLALFIANNIGLPLMAFGLISGIYLLIKKNRSGLFILINAIVPVILLLLVNPFYFTKDRYVFFVLPFWILLGALGYENLRGRFKDQGGLLVFGILALLAADAFNSNLLYYQINHGNRHNWNAAFELVRQRSEPGDQVVTLFTEYGLYYNVQEIKSWGDLNVEEVQSSGQTYWFILDEETMWANPEMKSLIEQEGQLIDIIYQRRVNDSYLKVWMYDPEG